MERSDQTMEKNKLREKDIYKLAEVLNVPVEELVKLDGLGLLNTTETKCILAERDWKILKKQRRYQSGHIIEALSREYLLTISQVESAVYGKKQFKYYCKECGTNISAALNKKNGGVCNRCIVQSIKI